MCRLRSTNRINTSEKKSDVEQTTVDIAKVENTPQANCADYKQARNNTIAQIEDQTKEHIACQEENIQTM